MTRWSARRIRNIRTQLRHTVMGPEALAFLPAIVLAAFWFGGEAWLLLVALGLPVLYGVTGAFGARDGERSAQPRDSVTGLSLRPTLEDALDDRLDSALARGRATACFLMEIDDFDELANRYGQGAADEILARTAERLRAAMRSGDLVCRVDRAEFGVALATVAHLDLEIAIQIAARLQTAVEEPIALGATVIYVSCSIGFCHSARVPERTGLGIITAAERALDGARRAAPSAIRAFTAEMGRRTPARAFPKGDLAAALEAGQIVPFFQPQVSTDTGQVTGFEALARWCHPERGVIPPAEFLPVLEKAGQMERLGEIVLTRALAAVSDWDRAGLRIPAVGVNFAGDELHDPKLIEKVRWQLDRFDLSPERLTVEVLETVVAASPDDVIARNINGLAKLGCRIDLDDFGTGHASISSIRRFAVSRIKIDRSFVMKVDRDAEQQKMISAILTMAERLGLESLAEGVETGGEHATLGQLGCGHVQGFGIARPMPVEQTADWVRTHLAALSSPPEIGRHLG
ncbi:MAG: putative bifunctional diguanylate cyclase/phosphodiesterase [Pseudooceanicola sp.]